MTPIAEEELHRIVGRIYESVAESDALDDVLATLAARFDAHSAVLFTPALPPDQGGLFILHNQDPEAIRRYCEYYFDLDVWWHSARARSVDGTLRVVTGAELIAQRDFERSEFYNDFLRPNGTYHVIASDIRVLPAPRPLDVSLAFHGRRCHPGFGPQEKAVLEVLIPHLRRALQLEARLAGAFDGVQLAVDVLEAVTDGILLLTADGRVLHATKAARNLLAAGGGLRLSNGRLTAWLARDNAEIAAAIARAAGTAGALAASTVAVCAPHADQPLIVSVFPLPYRRVALGDLQNARVLVVLRDPARPPTTCWSAFARYFSITPAEVRLCQALADDLTLPEYCARHGIGESTARTQLRSVFAKTGVRRQAELMQLLRAFG